MSTKPACLCEVITMFDKLLLFNTCQLILNPRELLYKNTENTFSSDDDEEEDGDDNINNDLAHSSMLCLYLSKKNLHPLFFSIHT